MYSLEQRKRATKMYIKYELKAAPVIRELGYPDRHLLKSDIMIRFRKTVSFSCNHIISGIF